MSALFKQFHIRILLFILYVLPAALMAQTKYTSYNMWYEDSERLYAINYKRGKLLPAGTEVTDAKLQKGRRSYIAFKALGKQFVVYYTQKYHGDIPVDRYFELMFTDKTFDQITAGLSQKEIAAIKKGKIEPGMSKKAVLICYGPPPEHRTPKLQNNTWYYWSNRFRSMDVNFGADGLTLPEGKKPAKKPTKAPDLVKLQEKPKVQVDTQPPSITITEPAVTRGMRLASKTIMVRGKAEDPSGVYEVLINGAEANLSTDGTFWTEVLLAVGENTIYVRARDTRNNVADETFIIVREGDQPAPAIAAAPAALPNLEAARYFALIIAVQDYENSNINDLDEPIRDAERLKNTLSRQYTFEPENIVLLKNPNREEIIQKFEEMSKRINKNDNLLVFYAGHGFWDEKFQQGYWLPSNASRENRTKWISNSTIVDFIRGIGSNHTLLITDACFSGGIFKTRKAFNDAPPAINELYKLPSRKAMTSGTLKEVPDRSVFVEYLNKRLQENSEKYLTSEQLFVSFRTAVINNSPVNQIPQYGEIRQSGDEGGDFVFIRK